MIVAVFNLSPLTLWIQPVVIELFSAVMGGDRAALPKSLWDFLFNWRPIISRSTGPIFAEFSPNRLKINNPTLFFRSFN